MESLGLSAGAVYDRLGILHMSAGRTWQGFHSTGIRIDIRPLSNAHRSRAALEKAPSCVLMCFPTGKGHKGFYDFARRPQRIDSA